MIYFDNSATTKPDREVIAEVAECMELYYANPSSAHKLGIEAEKKLKTARAHVAALVNAAEQEIIFTSGGSEANNMAISGVIDEGCHIISSKIEHPSTIKLLQLLEKKGIEVTYLDVDSAGVICIEELKQAIKDNTRLVTIMHVNNEIGSIQPVYELTKLVKGINRRIKVHIDAVQSAGKLELDMNKLEADLVSISAHKLHGPKGIGALYIRKNTNIRPFIVGGGQEGNLRSGTENIPGIAGFGIAAQKAHRELRDRTEKVALLKSYFIERLSELEGVRINSLADQQHVPHILNVSFERVRGEVLLHALEDYRIYVSTGSACSSKDTKHSNYVLPAIGLKEEHIKGAIRFSFAFTNEKEEIDTAIAALKEQLPFLRRMRG